MKVLFIAAEATPLAKVGGLADVAGELPRALIREGVEPRVVLPLHSTIKRSDYQLEPLPHFPVPHREGSVTAELFELEYEGVHYWLVDGDPVRSAPGVYSDPARDADKYVFTSLAALIACEAYEWNPALLHAHDWHAAPAVSKLRQLREEGGVWTSVASLLTIHNLPYLGIGSETALDDYDVPSTVHPALPDWARRLPLAAGIAAADWLSTVSPTYAKEIQTERYGSGLERLISARRDRLVGILNGIDYSVWDPAIDGNISAQFDTTTVEIRSQDTAHLRKTLGLPETAGPLMGMITRLDYQKGVDLALEALAQIVDLPWQFVLLGTGDQRLEQLCQTLADRFPDRVRFLQKFDPLLSRQIYAGCDLILIPSRYEPCGLAQLIGMRYGAVPVVRSTGGLKDTVQDVDVDPGGVGFTFEDEDPDAFAAALRRAIIVFRKHDIWRELQVRGMRRDHSWDASARSYVQLYEKASRSLGI